MNKHLDIKIEGDLQKTDFNYYCQTGAFKFNINAIYVNGNTRDVDLSTEGEEEDLKNYIQYLQSGPLSKYIESFEVTEGPWQGIEGFKSKRHKQEEKKGFLKKLLRK